MKEKGSYNRRGFIKSTVIGATGALFASRAIGQTTKEKAGKKFPEQKFIYRTLGNTGVKLPIVSMGVMRADNPNLVAAALDAGIKHLDTAYGYQQGRNEEMIGKVVKERPRDSFFIATKMSGVPIDRETGQFTKEATTEAFLEILNTSLKRLDLEYVDLLHIHKPRHREAALFEPLLKAFEMAKKNGKIRFIGLSTHDNQPEVIQAAIDSKFYEVVLTSYNYTMDNRKELKQAIANAANAGLGVIAMKTMAGGFLDRERQKPVNAKAALKWALQDTNIHTSIPGFTTFDQMAESLSVMEDLTLTEEEMNDLEKGKNVTGLYCQGCWQCLDQCSQRLPIPDIMRAYMYTYGYRELEKARDLLLSLDLGKNVCEDCGNCLVNCAKGFNISEKIRDVIRLRNVPSDFIV